MFDNRIRERLTGAAILVALIVLLVPELLSRPQHAGVQQAAAADEAPIRSYRMSLGDSQQSAMPVTAVTPPASVAPRGPGPSGAPASAGTLASPGTPVGEAAPSPPTHATPAAPVPHVPAPHVPAPHAESVAGGWAVQVGSFGSRENADRLVHGLKLKGYGAFITESSSRGRKWYRVRVGPERSRAAADAIATRLRATGFRGAVAQAR